MRIAISTILAVVFACACADTTPRTQTVVVLRAADGVREVSTHVSVRISGRSSDANAWETDETRTVTLDRHTRFPLLLPLTPRDGDASRQFRVDATAYRDGTDGELASRARVQSGFVMNATRVVELTFDDGCSAVVCDEAATCLDGTCVDAHVPVDALEDPGESIDRCEYDNGGCDPNVRCTSRHARAICGACPSGFVARDDARCLLDDPSLVSLHASTGFVEDFDADTSRIVVRLYLDSTSVMLRPVLRSSGGTVTIDGAPVVAGGLSASIETPLGVRDLAMVVTTETGATRTYTVSLVRDVELAAYVKAPVPMRDAIYASTAVSGDTFVVGAPRETVMTTNGTVTSAGAVHVYRRSPGGDVVFEQTIIASNPGAGDEFGYDVQIDGDRMIVSAPFEDSSASTIGGERFDEGLTNSGAVYVFERTGRTWIEVGYIKVASSEPNRTLGLVIALDGNVIVAGTPYEDGATGATPNAGAVYVIERTDDGFVLAATLRASISRAEDRFGGSMDVDATTIIVGAPGEDGTSAGINGDPNAVSADAGFDAGAAYVFTRGTSGTWGLAAYLKPPYPSARDGFGTSVAVSGDVAVVGARAEDSNSTASNADPAIDGLDDSGAAFVFTRRVSAWFASSMLKAHAPSVSDHFGSGVAIDRGIIVVSAPGEDGAGGGVNPSVDELASNSGGVYVYVQEGTMFTFRAYLKAPETDTGDLFAALSVDAGRIFIGSRFEDGAGGDPADDSLPDSGAAYLFE